jgi:hypothetical protein
MVAFQNAQDSCLAMIFEKLAIDPACSGAPWAGNCLLEQRIQNPWSERLLTTPHPPYPVSVRPVPAAEFRGLLAIPSRFQIVSLVSKTTVEAAWISLP